MGCGRSSARADQPSQKQTGGAPKKLHATDAKQQPAATNPGIPGRPLPELEVKDSQFPGGTRKVPRISGDTNSSSILQRREEAGLTSPSHSESKERESKERIQSKETVV